ncbi:SRPBCC family protein [Dongia sedimenti]|uniref:SRPBCC family protein n=1 Tax=Dongia sedimenti TaxID=3064282 RepID=A0ABU0YK10_9PROT|nr:SRPBCC family protein [Rhodospirillaceae bacterium R-7]
MIEVSRSAVIPAPAQRAWALVRDFNAMPEWNATIRSSTIEDGPADRIGCRRILRFDDGSTWTHQLTDLSDAGMTIAYAIVGIPPATKLPMRNYHAVIRIEPIDGDRCRMTWRATLETDQEDAVRERAGAVFQAGFDGLKRRLGV